MVVGTDLFNQKHNQNMGSHNSTPAIGRTPAAKCSNSTTSCLQRLFRLTSSDSASSMVSNHSCKQSIYAPTSRLTSHKTLNGRSTNAQERLISSLEKKVLHLVQDKRVSTKLINDKQLKSQSNNLPEASNRQATLTTTAHKKQSRRSPTERRHDSCGANDSDVFIYPPNYMDMNECHKCSRDNKICNCIVIEPLAASTQVADSALSVESTDTICDKGGGGATRNTINSTKFNRKQMVTRQQNDKSNTPNGNRQTSESNQNDSSVVNCVDFQQDGSQIKNVYKISIASACSIDQNNNQLHLSAAPKIVLPKSFAFDPNGSWQSLNIKKKKLAECNDLNMSSAPNDRKLAQSEIQIIMRDEHEHIMRNDSLAYGASIQLPSSWPSDSTALPLGGARGVVTRQQPQGCALRLRAQSIPARMPLSPMPVVEQTTNPTITTTSLGYLPNSNSDHHQLSDDDNPTRSAQQYLSQANEKITPQRITTMCFESPTRSSDSNKKLNNDIDCVEQNKKSDNATNFIINTLSSSDEPHEDLTCDVSLGATTARITNCASIVVDKDQLSGEPINSNTIVSYQINQGITLRKTGSYRRKNPVPKLSRQAVFDDLDCRKCVIVTKPPDSISVGDPTRIRDDDSIDTGNLDYSPILTGVRDYIENINPELKLQGSIVAKQIGIDGNDSIVSANTVGQMDVPLRMIDIHSKSIDLQPSDIIVQTSPPTTVVASSSAFGLPPTNTNLEGITSSVNLSKPETPKKSIFDGASKDEILEYLEDARERVPEALIAADEVMVISENELIVVNQLEPDSPATPISIVEASEVMKSNTAPIHSIEDVDAMYPQTTTATTTLSQENSYQFMHHLEQMYHTSRLASTVNDDTDRVIDAENRHRAGFISKCESRYDSIDAGTTISTDSNQVFSPQTGARKSTSCVAGVTLDSIEDYLPDNIDNSNNNDDRTLNMKASDTGIHRKAISSSPVQSTDNRKSVSFPIQSIKTTSSPLSNRSFKNQGAGRCGQANYHNIPSVLFDGRRRRKSTSESSGRVDERNCTLQLMLLQQHYTNRDSLSSSSSSSPSTSNSSNQTSGNCSATSTFYASSSLSCSSPFLALTSLASSSSLAFSKSPAVPTNSPSLIHKQEHDNHSIGKLSTQATQNSPRPVDALDKSVSVLQVERDDSGLGAEFLVRSMVARQSITEHNQESVIHQHETINQTSEISNQKSANGVSKSDSETMGSSRLSVIEEIQDKNSKPAQDVALKNVTHSMRLIPTTSTSTFTSPPGFLTRPLHSHYATINRLNNYLTNRGPINNLADTMIEFQCLDCDQFIRVDHAKMLHKTNEIKLLRENDVNLESFKNKPMTSDQLERAYIVAMNGLPLCKSCEKKRIERKEIISEFVETELKYGRDLKIIHDEFYRPMQIAGLLNKDQINGIFLNLEELIMAHCRFADRLETSISEAHSIGDINYNTVNIGKLFVESADMLHTFESYCIRQGSAACLLARLAKEKELLRIFLRVSQMENTLLRRMNLAAFLMVPVQRVTKYPLLLNRLYKVTPYHHKDREALRDAQLKVELHLEHINQQTKGISATNKIWRRISNLSAPISSRRGLINAEDIGYIKLRKSAMDMLKWDRDETQFIHSGKINFAPLNEYLVKQKMKSLRYIAVHALLIVLGKPNWKYRPDLVKSNLDNKLMSPTPGGNGIKEAALLIFREKNGRFVACREPLFLSNCVLSNDCSQFNSECPLSQQNHCIKQSSSSTSGTNNAQLNSSDRKSLSGVTGVSPGKRDTVIVSEFRAASAESNQAHHASAEFIATKSLSSKGSDASEHGLNSAQGDSVSMSSLKSLPEEQSNMLPSPPAQAPRSYSLASALPRTPITATSSSSNLTKSSSTTSSNLTILNQLMTKVNNYHHKHGCNVPTKPTTEPSKISTNILQTTIDNSDPNNTNNNAQSLIDLQMHGGHHGDHNQAGISMNQQHMGSGTNGKASASDCNHHHYNHHFFYNYHQPYGDYEESFEIHERLSKESLLLRADTPLKTRYWLQILRYHAKDLGQWRTRRNGLANIMMMRQE